MLTLERRKRRKQVLSAATIDTNYAVQMRLQRKGMRVMVNCQVVRLAVVAI